MKSLRKKRELCRLQTFSAMSKFEVCNKLQPFVAHFGLTFTENEICFPQPLCCEQHIIYISACCENLYERSIRFSDIVYIRNNNKRLCLLLRTGHVFYFFSDHRFWYIRNALDFGQPTALTVWWWMFSGKIIQWLGNRFGRDISADRT